MLYCGDKPIVPPGKTRGSVGSCFKRGIGIGMSIMSNRAATGTSVSSNSNFSTPSTGRTQYTPTELPISTGRTLFMNTDTPLRRPGAFTFSSPVPSFNDAINLLDLSSDPQSMLSPIPVTVKPLFKGLRLPLPNQGRVYSKPGKEPPSSALVQRMVQGAERGMMASEDTMKPRVKPAGRKAKFRAYYGLDIPSLKPLISNLPKGRNKIDILAVLPIKSSKLSTAAKKKLGLKGLKALLIESGEYKP
jgi:hypothetical protein